MLDPQGCDKESFTNALALSWAAVVSVREGRQEASTPQTAQSGKGARRITGGYCPSCQLEEGCEGDLKALGTDLNWVP